MLCVHIGNIGSYKPPMDVTNLDALGGSVTFIENKPESVDKIHLNTLLT